jgi:ABC-type lipoprotein release transport system permease subunit
MIVYPSADIRVLIMAVFLAILISAAAAVIPARRAGKLAPVDALRHI